MRIISGEYGGRRFDKKIPPGIRPTTDSNKEMIFNILVNILDIGNALVLDIFSGSGGLGFEAISRGAASCTFVDRSKKAVNYIQRAIDYFNITNDRFHLVRKDAVKFISGMGNAEMKYDLIFLDPPYEQRICNSIIQSIIDNSILKKGGIIVAESSLDEGIILDDGYSLIRHKQIGSTQIHFIEKDAIRV